MLILLSLPSTLAETLPIREESFPQKLDPFSPPVLPGLALGPNCICVGSSSTSNPSLRQSEAEPLTPPILEGPNTQ